MGGVIDGDAVERLGRCTIPAETLDLVFWLGLSVGLLAAGAIVSLGWAVRAFARPRPRPLPLLGPEEEDGW